MTILQTVVLKDGTKFVGKRNIWWGLFDDGLFCRHYIIVSCDTISVGKKVCVPDSSVSYRILEGEA
jgi:hypothetical protein